MITDSKLHKAATCMVGDGCGQGQLIFGNQSLNYRLIVMWWSAEEGQLIFDKQDIKLRLISS